MIRKIKRNILKRQLGTNQIHHEWYRIQVEKFGGFKRYWSMRKEMRKRRTA